MKFHMGEGLLVDLEVLVDTRLLVQANSGGGKSWCLRRLLEQTEGKIQHLVLDPEGEFSSLREKFPYALAARSGGDTPAHPKSARLLAERLLEIGCSAVLDLYELPAPERVAFVRQFVEALVDAPKALWHPVLVVLDEAHVYCPQAGDAESAGAVKDLCTRGRKRGFAAVLATQRLAKLHKDAAAECNNKLIGRTGLDVDRSRAADELGMPKSESLALRELAPGDFLAYGPAFGLTGVRRTRIGAVVTRHPKAGARLETVVPPPPERVKALLPRLSDIPGEVERKKQTEAELRAEIQTLRAQVAAKPRAEVERVVVEAVSDKRIEEVRIAAARLHDAVIGLSDTADTVKSALSTIAEALQRTRAAQPGSSTKTPTVAPVSRVGERRRHNTEAAGSPHAAPTSESFSTPRNGRRAPHERILDAVAWLYSINAPEPAETAVAFLAGYTPDGGAFLRARGHAEHTGLITRRDGAVYLTDEGRPLAHFPPADPTGGDLRKRVFERLSSPERRLLEPLLHAYPGGLGDADLGAASGYSHEGGAFLRARGRLRNLGLVTRHDGITTASSILFPESEGA